MIKATAIFSILTLLSAGQLQAETETRKFESKDITSLELRNTSGKIDIRGSGDTEAVVTVDKIKMGKGCTMTIENEGGKLLVEIKDSGWIKRSRCHADIALVLPEKVSIDLKSGAGSIAINKTEGDIKFLSGSGDITINEAKVADLFGKVGSGNILIDGALGKSDIRSGSGSLKIYGDIGHTAIRNGSGNVVIEGLKDTADILTGSGNVSLKYSDVKSGSFLKIRSGSGDATVTLPENSKIATDFSTGSGKIFNELGDTENPDFNISFKAGSGNLKIKKSK